MKWAAGLDECTGWMDAVAEPQRVEEVHEPAMAEDVVQNDVCADCPHPVDEFPL
jgi:hypothetical protein